MTPDASLRAPVAGPRAARPARDVRQGGDVLAAPLATTLGGRAAGTLARKLGLSTVGDLLTHLPRRYVQRGDLTDITALRPGEDATVLGEVRSVTSRPMKARRGSVEQVEVTDGRASLWLTFFNQPWRRGQLPPGVRGLFAGRVEVRGRHVQLVHPEYVLFDDPDHSADVEQFAGAPIPVYPTTAGLPSWRIATCVRTALDVIDELPDPVPDRLLDRYGLVGLREAFERVHRPSRMGDWEPGWRRLRWEEAFVLQVALARRRAAAAARPALARRRRPGGVRDAFDARLPFPLTASQQAVGGTLDAELAGTRPMARLLTGEVGSGKTVVALRAMLTVVDAGGQAVLLAPTEVLAYQHYRTLRELMGPLARPGELGGDDRGTQVALLTGGVSAPARRRALDAVAAGQAGIVVGTHALLTDDVRFHDLALVVVDEQQRFGVEQRDVLRTRADPPPHLLVMSATPIPRTVAMTVFGDLDVSSLTDLPAGRAGVSTYVVPVRERPHYLRRAWERVREEVAAGHQAYVVCPRVGDDTDDAAAGDGQPGDGPADGAGDGPGGGPGDGPVGGHAVLSMAAELAAGPLAGLRLATVHGQAPSEVKEDTMRRFAAGDIDVLVATTVIEVGVDVPNATALVVLDADRFGYAQLHQLRGRIGRGAHPGVALLVTDLPAGHSARGRVETVAGTSDGAALALADLEARHEGDLLGPAQSGRSARLRLVRVQRDEELIDQARTAAGELVAADPTLSGHPVLAQRVGQLEETAAVDYLDKA